jgi:subtilase family serine protease
VSSRRRNLLLRPLLVCVAACLSCGLLAGQASAAAPPCADLQIENIVVSPTNPVQGMPASIAITIHNGGTCAAGGFVTQFRTSVSSPTGPSESLSGLAAGESRTLTLPFVFTSAGNYEAVVQTDTGNAVSETNEENNLEIFSITVLPPGINLVLDKFTVAPVALNPTDSVVQGRVARATITITNTGNVPAGPFVVQWTPYAFAKPLTKSVSGLASGATTVVTMEYTFPTATTVTGVALVDSTNEVTETDELDNSATLETVVEPPLPNLLVAPKSVQVHPAPAGGISTIQLEVENNGNNPAGDFVVTWKPGPLIAAQSQQVNGLAVGARKTISFSNVYKSAGTYNGTITVDSTHVVAEVNEADNTAPTVLVVPAATIDLTITNMSIQEEEINRGNGDAKLYAGSTVTQAVPDILTVTVKNLGNSPSGSFVTSWNPDTQAIIVPGNQTLTQETEPLGPGQSRELQFLFTYPKAGNFRSLADVDAFNTVKETNESNNERILNVTVQPAQIGLYFTSPITFSPAQPVVGEKATATFTIRNYGPIATGAFAVQLTPQSGAAAKTQFVSGLNVGEERTLSYPVTYSKAGSFTATAVIDPTNKIVKTETPDEEQESVTVAKKSASLRLKLSSLEDVANPGGWEEWVVFLFAYQPNAPGCTVGIKIETPLSSKEFEKELKEVVCSSTGNTLREPYFNPPEKRGSNASVDLFLEEKTPLAAGTLALNICEGLCLDIGQAGLTTLIEPRTEYLNPPAGEKEEEGKSCEQELNGGHCYNAFFELSLLGHVGMSANRASHAAAGTEQESVAAAESTVQQADTEVEALAAQAKTYEAEVGAESADVSITTEPAGG